MNNKRLFTAEHAGYSINRTKLLRVLLDGKVECRACERKYTSEEKSFKGVPRMNRLLFTDWVSCHDPDKLTIELMCGFCSHKGMFNMEPNPFMDFKNIDKYAAILAGKEVS